MQKSSLIRSIPIIAELFYSVKDARDRLDQEIRNKRLHRMESFKEKVVSGDIPEREVARGGSKGI